MCNAKHTIFAVIPTMHLYCSIFLSEHVITLEIMQHIPDRLSTRTHTRTHASLPTDTVNISSKPLIWQLTTASHHHKTSFDTAIA